MVLELCCDTSCLMVRRNLLDFYHDFFLSETERKYSQIEKEALACVFGVKQFHSYLYGPKFILQTDHKPLLMLYSENQHMLQIAYNDGHGSYVLASYEYIIQWRKTDQHANADTMSHLPLPEIPEATTYSAS